MKRNVHTTRKPTRQKAVSKKAGLPPGSVIYVGEQRVSKTALDVIDYDEKELVEKHLDKVEDALDYKSKASTTWLNVIGLHDTRIIETLGEHYGIHPLVQEDIVNTAQRPTTEEFPDQLFISLKMLSYDQGKILSEQVSIIQGANFVISFQEAPGDVFDPVRERIRGGRWRIRKHGSDYLSYALIDSVVDHYFIVLESIGDRIEKLEEQLSTAPAPEALSTIHSLKRELIELRKSVWPLREVINKLQKSDSPLIKKQTRIYFSDVYDHTIQVIDTIESYRDMVSGLLDLYLSQSSNRMNEIMKVLTIFAAIFIPLTFIAGIYGMNFDIMPELRLPFGYAGVWLVFILVGVGMLAYFKRKGWL